MTHDDERESKRNDLQTALDMTQLESGGKIGAVLVHPDDVTYAFDSREHFEQWCAAHHVKLVITTGIKRGKFGFAEASLDEADVKALEAGEPIDENDLTRPKSIPLPPMPRKWQ